MSEHEQMKDTEYSTLWHKLAARFAILSEDDLACWEESLEKYADSWDWCTLSGNSAVPWDRELVARYHDQID